MFANRAAKYGFVEVRQIDPTIVTDLRYATRQNVVTRNHFKQLPFRFIDRRLEFAIRPPLSTRYGGEGFNSRLQRARTIWESSAREHCPGWFRFAGG